VIVLSVCPDAAVAQQIAETLVRERLAACVNRVTGVRSTYIWDGAVQDDSEVLLVIKTLESRVAELEARLGTVHPYTLPEVIAIPVCGGSERYLEWMRRAVSGS
jgi:periplasmic divalent cation tolerance protein